MNTITHKLTTGATLLAVFMMVAFVATPVAHATDMGGDTGWIDTGSYGGDTGWIDTGSYGGDTGWIDTGSYGAGYDSYTPSYFGGGYSFGGGFGFGGGFSTPVVAGGSNMYAPTNNLVTNNGNTSTYAPVYAPTTVTTTVDDHTYAPYNWSNYAPTTITTDDHTYAPTTIDNSTYSPTTITTNTCTSPNSCNSTVDDHSIYDAHSVVTIMGGSSQSPVVYQPPQVIYTQPYPQPYYLQAPYYPSSPTYPTYHAPYVSLSAVPYTGLDLGPVGTVLYWSFLVLWCIAAAYLVAVKKVQNKIVAGINNYLYPKTTHTAHTAHATHAPVKAKAHATVHTTPATQGIDPFIAAQIGRAR